LVLFLLHLAALYVGFLDIGWEVGVTRHVGTVVGAVFAAVSIGDEGDSGQEETKAEGETEGEDEGYFGGGGVAHCR
jgi:hypothetical protein